MVVICATHDLLSKHLQKMLSIDASINQQFAERTGMQTRYQTEQQRLLAMFKKEQQKAVKATDRPFRPEPQTIEAQSTASSFNFGNKREIDVKLATNQPRQITKWLEETMCQTLAPTIDRINGRATETEKGN